ncbi:hypothetical protein [Pseudonocardia sp. NPDC049635]|uniref:hypothetical protein n=1 Tax=Pseudonocardia sp. NPDC049635 TaxID=3155506 RepID=UPI0033DB0AA4
MSHLAIVFDLYIQQDPPPLIPDAGPGELPGRLGENVTTFIASIKAVLIAIAVVMGLVGSGLIMVGQRSPRSGSSFGGIEKLGMVILGLAVMGSITSIIGLFL